MKSAIVKSCLLNFLPELFATTCSGADNDKILPLITRQMFITSGGEPEVIYCVSIGHGQGMLRLGYLAVFRSARIVKLYPLFQVYFHVAPQL